MASQGNGQFKKPYEVVVSGKILQDLEELRTLAIAMGVGPAFVAAWESAFHRLETDPWSFGELFKHLKHAKLKVHVRLLKPLLIEFGIHEEQPFVFIAKVTLYV